MPILKSDFFIKLQFVLESSLIYIINNITSQSRKLSLLLHVLALTGATLQGQSYSS